MRTLIRSHINADQIPLFNSLLRNVVKKRLSDLLGGNPNHNTKKCLSVYRKLYPKNMDENLIANLKNRILQGQLPPVQPGIISYSANCVLVLHMVSFGNI